jgi:hypothetical protein
MLLFNIEFITFPQIGLPYHRPRQRTLDEFLNRKKGTPELIADMKKLPRYLVLRIL